MVGIEEVGRGIWKRGGKGNYDQDVKTNHKKGKNTTKVPQMIGNKWQQMLRKKTIIFTVQCHCGNKYGVPFKKKWLDLHITTYVSLACTSNALPLTHHKRTWTSMATAILLTKAKKDVSLNKVSHQLRYLNTWYTVGGTLWGGYRRYNLAGGNMSLG